jgi:hypothetical protein
MMVPIRGGSLRNGIGSGLSGRMLFIKIFPLIHFCGNTRELAAHTMRACPWSQHGPDKFKGVFLY